VAVRKKTLTGFPSPERISTSYVETQNPTVRTHCRRLTRLTNALSTRIENFKAAIGLHFGCYNFVTIHGAIRMTPAMKANAVSALWNTADLVEAAIDA
jgi:hypothetical protein